MGLFDKFKGVVDTVKDTAGDFTDSAKDKAIELAISKLPEETVSLKGNEDLTTLLIEVLDVEKPSEIIDAYNKLTDDKDKHISDISEFGPVQLAELYSQVGDDMQGKIYTAFEEQISGLLPSADGIKDMIPDGVSNKIDSLNPFN